MVIDRAAPLQFLRSAFRPDDWIAVLLKAHDTGATAQRVGLMSRIANPKFQVWLRAENARRFSVFESVNAIRPQHKARTPDAIEEIRHVFLDADRNGHPFWPRSRPGVTFRHHPVWFTRRRIGCTCSGMSPGLRRKARRRCRSV